MSGSKPSETIASVWPSSQAHIALWHTVGRLPGWPHGPEPPRSPADRKLITLQHSDPVGQANAGSRLTLHLPEWTKEEQGARSRGKWEETVGHGSKQHLGLL